MGLGSLLSGIVSVLSLFSHSSSETVQWGGSGKGFWNYYSSTGVIKRTIPLESFNKYAFRMCDNIMAMQAPFVKAKNEELVAEIQSIVEFGDMEFADDPTEQMIQTVSYNKAYGQLYVFIYTFKPFLSSRVNKYAVRIENINITCNFEMARDWMIVTKAKCSFFSSSVKSEIKYLPDKGIQTSDIVDAISIAMAPCIFGFVSLPDRYYNMIDNLLTQEINAAAQYDQVTGENTAKAAQEARSTLETVAQQQNQIIDRVAKGAEQIGDYFSERSSQSGGDSGIGAAPAVDAGGAAPEGNSHIHRRKLHRRFHRRPNARALG